MVLCYIAVHEFVDATATLHRESGFGAEDLPYRQYGVSMCCVVSMNIFD